MLSQQLKDRKETTADTFFFFNNTQHNTNTTTTNKQQLYTTSTTSTTSKGTRPGTNPHSDVRVCALAWGCTRLKDWEYGSVYLLQEYFDAEVQDDVHGLSAIVVGIQLLIGCFASCVLLAGFQHYREVQRRGRRRPGAPTTTVTTSDGVLYRDVALVMKTSEVRRCSTCGKPKTADHELFQCQRCRVTYYCNRECQAKHWVEGGHKRDCLPGASNGGSGGGDGGGDGGSGGDGGGDGGDGGSGGGGGGSSVGVGGCGAVLVGEW